MEKYIGKGYTGLKNLGNTCFINSCIQILSHTYELTELLNSEKTKQFIKSDINDRLMFEEYNALIQLMWSQNGIVGPNKFLFTVHNVAKEKNKEIFTGFAQNDMSEFLQFLVDCLHNTVSRKMLTSADGKIEEYSEIMNLFYGKYVSKIMSIDTNTIYTQNVEPFFMLCLPIPKEFPNPVPTLYDCFRKFADAEVLTGENRWFNEKENAHQDVVKQYSFIKFPQICIILLERFIAGDGFRKNEILVDFPIDDLDVSSFMDTSAAASSPRPKYRLFGVCNHMGNVLFGHYTSFVRNAANEWIHYNDERVEKVDDPRQMITPMAYCLFYRRIDGDGV